MKTESGPATILAEVIYRFGASGLPRPQPADAHAARLRLESGNRKFAELLSQPPSTEGVQFEIHVDPSDVGLCSGHSNSPPQQSPFAAIVGCADARVPVELIFAEGPNDLFVVRIAGNGLGDDVLGSLNYAVDRLKDSLRTIVVLGHSSCGAVSAAVDVYLAPYKYMETMTQKDLRHILDRILVVVQTGAMWLERVYGADVVRKRGYRASLTEVAIALNSALTGLGIQETLIRSSREGVSVLYGIYVLEDRLVWSPTPDDSECFRLSPCPRDTDEFARICDCLVSSPRIRRLLES